MDRPSEVTDETPYMRERREEREAREAHNKLLAEYAGPIREMAEQAIAKHAVSLHLVELAKQVGLLEKPPEEEARRGVAHRLWYDFEKDSQRRCGWLGFTDKLALQLISKIEPLQHEIFLNRY